MIKRRKVMKLFRLVKLRSCLVLVVTGILILSFVAGPLSIVYAPGSILERKWRSVDSLPTGAWEGGFVIGDINKTNSGEEVIYAGTDYVYALSGIDGHTLWKYYDTAIDGYAKPNLYDIDGNGDLEILVPLYYPPGLLVLNGNGTLWWRRSFGSGGSIMNSPVACDVDGDGKLEIFLAMQDVEAGPNTPTRFDGQIRKFTYDGTLLAQSFVWRSCSGGVSIADTDNDGEFEIYVGDRDVYMNDGCYGKGVRSFWASNLTQRWNYPDWLCSSQCPVIADVNKDGILDVIVSNQRGGLIVLNSTNGSPIKMETRIPLPGPTPNSALPGHQQLTVYDIDYDGNLEVLTADGAHPSNQWPADEVVIFDLYTWTVDARIKVGLPDTPDTGQFAPTLADVDNDGKMEIIAVDDFGLQVFKYTEQRDSLGLQIYEKIYADDGSALGPPSGASWKGLIYGRYAIVQDIDADGLLEVVVVSTSHRIYAWDTNAPAPPPERRIRSEVIWYSEYRRGAAEYIAPPAKTKTMVQLSEQIARRGTATTASLSIAETQDPWYNTDWQYRRNITINHNLVSASLSGFPVLVDVTNESLASNAQSDGDDFLFTDSSGTKLAHEIESYDSGSGHLVAWVNVPNLSASEDTVLYMYYGNPTAGNQQNPMAVWDSDYMMVQHLDETSVTHYDSTSNGNNGTLNGVTPNPAGKVDGADSFDGSNDDVSVPHSGTITGFTQAFTASFWVKMDVVTGRRTFLNKYNINSQRAWAIDYDSARGDNRLGLFVSQNGVTYPYWYASFSPVAGNWYHIAVVWQSGLQPLFYVNGALVSATTATAIPSIYNNSLEPLYIGRSYTTGRYFDGTIDEVRLSNIARSAGWIQTCFNSQNNNAAFITLGPEETPPQGNHAPDVSSPSPANGATNVQINLSELSFNLSDYEGDLIDYNVTMTPDAIGGVKEGTDVVSGTTVHIPIMGNLQNGTAYTWTVKATDPVGSGKTTTRIYTFTTEQPPVLWYSPDWQYRRNVTINHTLVSSGLTDFPVLVDVTNETFTSNALSDGGDFLFTDSLGNKLAHEIEKYESGTGHLVAWVNVPNLSASEDTLLYLYYGNPTAGNQQNPAAVWDADYMMVQHLNETSGIHYDSTVNGNNGTSINGVVQDATGKIDGADMFDGTNGYVTVPHSSTLTGFTQASTVEAWIKMDNIARRQVVANKYTDAGSQRGWFVEYYSNQIRFFASLDGSSYQYWSATLNPVVDTWYYLTVVWQANHIPKFYINGQLVPTSRTGTIPSIYNNTGAPLDIGRSTYSTDNRYFDGVIDEVRISNVSRSASWIQTCFNSQNNSAAFISLGPEETYEPPPPPPPVISSPSPQDGASNVPIDLSQLSFVVSDPEGHDVSYTVTAPDLIVGPQSGTVSNGTTVYVTITKGPLDYNTAYTWTVDAADALNPGETATKTFTFTTEHNLPPEVSLPSPADKAVDVPISPAWLNFTLSDSDGDLMDYYLYLNGTLVALGSDVANGRFNVSQPDWSFSALYTWQVNVTDGVFWTNVTYSFTTKSPTLPTVVSHIPDVDETGVPVTSTIQVTFSEPMDRVSTECAFSINPSVLGSFSWSSGDAVMNFTPSSNLAYDTPYTVTISTAAKDKEDQSMLSVYVWSFRTEPPTFNVHLESRQNDSLTLNLGTMTFDGTSYGLPNDVSKAAGSYSAQYFAALGYVFDHWENTSGISVSSTTTNSTTVTVSGDGTLRAVYKAAPPYPYLVSSSGTNTTSEDLICYNNASGIYNWYVDGVSLTNLLFTFDANDSAIVKDYSPYGNNGMNHGATWTTGILNGAYYFDGDFDYIAVSDGGPGYFNGTSFPGTLGGDGSWPEITVELWIYLSENQNNVRFVAKLPSFEMGLSSGTANTLFAGVWTQNGTDFTEIGYRGYSSIKSNTSLSSGTWNHVAFTYNAAGLTLYLNGSVVGFTDRPMGNIHCSSGEPLYLGWFDYFHGKMDELRLYPRALSPEQIKQRFLEVKDGVVDRSTIVSQETLGSEVWKCNVTQGSSSKFSNTLRIVNNPPTVDNLRIGPHQLLTPSNSTSLVALYDYRDIDEFRLNSNIDEQPESGTEIRWYRNGALVGQYNNTRTLPFGAASPGESWNFSVRPRDGVDFGDLVNSSTVTIVPNSAPAISGTPSLTGTGGNLTCTTTSTDPENQPVTNIYNWYVDGASLANLILPFDTDNMLTAKDYSPYGNNGTISGATWTSEGVVGGAYVFDGNDFITVPDSNSLGPQTPTTGWSEISIEFWIKVTSNQNGSRIIARKLPWASSGSYMIGFQSSGSPSNTLFFGVSVPTEEAYAPTYTDIYDGNLSDPLNTVLTVGNWYHVICTYKSGLTDGLTIYINGTQRVNRVLNDTTVSGGGAIQPDTWRANDEPLIIGYDGSARAGSNRYFKGMLDEIKIYRRALTPAQVQQRFTESRNGQTSSATIVSQETSSGQMWYCQVIPNDKYQDGPAKNSNNYTIP